MAELTQFQKLVDEYYAMNKTEWYNRDNGYGYWDDFARDRMQENLTSYRRLQQITGECGELTKGERKCWKWLELHKTELGIK